MHKFQGPVFSEGAVGCALIASWGDANWHDCSRRVAALLPRDAGFVSVNGNTKKSWRRASIESEITREASNSAGPETKKPTRRATHIETIEIWPELEKTIRRFGRIGINVKFVSCGNATVSWELRLGTHKAHVSEKLGRSRYLGGYAY